MGALCELVERKLWGPAGADRTSARDGTRHGVGISTAARSTASPHPPRVLRAPRQVQRRLYRHNAFASPNDLRFGLHFKQDRASTGYVQ
ncbi:unnamed protein product, partial [Iphiclides podalirius]